MNSGIACPDCGNIIYSDDVYFCYVCNKSHFELGKRSEAHCPKCNLRKTSYLNMNMLDCGEKVGKIYLIDCDNCGSVCMRVRNK